MIIDNAKLLLKSRETLICIYPSNYGLHREGMLGFSLHTFYVTYYIFF